MLKISTKKVRQAGKGRHALFILVISLILAMLAWGLLEFYGRHLSESDLTNSHPHIPEINDKEASPARNSGI